MADDQFRFEAVLGFTSEGAEARLEEIGRIASDIEKLMETTDRSSDAFKQLSGDLDTVRLAMREYGKELSQNIEDSEKAEAKAAGLSDRFIKLSEALANISASFKDAQQEAAAFQAETAGLTAGNITQDDPRTWTTEQLQAYEELRRVQNLTFDGVVAEELRGRAQAAEATAASMRTLQDAVANYQTIDQAYDALQEAANLTELERAQQRVAAATKEHADASEYLQTALGAGTESEIADARNRMAAATRELGDANREKAQAIIADEAAEAAAREENSQRTIKALEDVAAAEDRVKQARDQQDYEQNIAHLDQAAQATARYTTAKEEQAKAEDAVVQAQAQYGPESRQVADANNQLADAIERTNTAFAQQQRSMDQSTQRMQQMRYQLYDVSRSMAVISGALIGVGAGATAAFASWESGMSNVYQTNMDKPAAELQNLEQRLMEVARTVPITTESIQGLATLAGQLEVTGDLGRFVETMAQFGMISDTVSAEDAAEAIAKLVNVMGGAESIQAITGAEDAYRAFATSIAQVGVTTAATDAEILHTASNLGIVGAQTNLTADQIIGLSAATASLGQPAERARSAFQDLVSVMNQGAAGGSVEQMEALARTMGMTREEILAMWDADPAAFFMRFLEAIKQADAQGQNMTSTLNSFGIEGKRALPVFSAMANNTDLVANSLEQAAIGFGEAEDEMSTFEQRMAHVADDLASIWQIFKNEVLLAAAAVGEALAPTLKTVLETVGPLLEQFSNWIQTPAGETFLRWATSLGAIVTALTLLFGAATAGAASFIALRAAIGGTPLGAFVARLALGKRGLDAYTASAGRAAVGTRVFAASLRAFGRATIVIGLLQLLMEVIFNFQNTVGAAANYIFWQARVIFNAMEAVGVAPGQAIGPFTAGLMALVSAAQQAANFIIQSWNRVASVFGLPLGTEVDFSGAIQGITSFQNAVSGFSWDGVRQGLDVLEDRINEWAGRGRHANQIDFGVGDTSSVDALLREWSESGEDIGNDIGDGIGKGVGNGAKKGAADARKELRTLVDYASDLQSVFGRAFDLRFQTTLSRDNISQAFHDLADAVLDANNRVRDLRQQIRDLRADMALTNASITQTEYFLSVAMDYGDMKRAEQLQAELLKLRAEQEKQNNDLADKTRELADAEAEASMKLTGSSKAAIAHRKTLTDLVQTYQDHLVALASSGMSQKELQREAQRLKKEFIQQATAMGYSEKEVRKYAAAFDDMGVIIDRVPRNVTIEFDGNPALTALREFIAQAENMLGNSSLNKPLGGGGGGPSAPIGGGVPTLVNPGEIGRRLGEGLRQALPQVERELVKTGQSIGDAMGTNVGNGFKKGFIGFEGFGGQVDPNGKSMMEIILDPRGLAAINGIPALLALIGTQSSDAFAKSFSGAGQHIGSILGSTMPPQLTKVGTDSGIAFENALKARGGPIGNSFSTEVTKSIQPVRSGFRKAGTGSGNDFRSSLNTALGNNLGAAMTNRAKAGGNSFRNEFRKYGTWAGNDARNNLNKSLRNGNYGATGRAIGAALRNAIVAELHRGNLGSLKVGGRKAGGGTLSIGYMAGGYTGAGPATQVAGIVHKGEYVVPKPLVNQRTGLPYQDALGRLPQGSRAQTSFAAGGIARGNDTLYVEFTANAIRQMQKGLPTPMVVIGNERVARAANAANFSSAKRGSN